MEQGFPKRNHGASGVVLASDPDHRVSRENLMLVRFGVGFVLAALTASTTMAAPVSPEDKAAMQLLCAGDFATLCTGLPPEDGPETRACFNRNMSKLSPGCRNAIEAYKKKG
ncbi:hypothetical protein MKK70_02985 [Methylobacterium sp. E-041]|jgi:hypothetical protein|uniref:hypothetical protein n=1 Tax=unclassified Methylobacterium TaxID=2615210 RepID=UPI001FBA20A7|nr:MULTISPECIES: hypothetical protein [unclassified Methylobacterium]MCJ2104364.1 hypothetical protein [Methylobacterium sp. E-041]MCJ2110544.1 hypothetical protein [Methylobacterium sp. E-025]